MIELHYRNHDSNGTQVRVWQSTWPGDAFEVITDHQFVDLEYFCKRLNITLLDRNGDD